jgi:hypothetical protein
MCPRQKKSVLFELFFSSLFFLKNTVFSSRGDGMEHCCKLSLQDNRSWSSNFATVALCDPRTLGNLMCWIGYSSIYVEKNVRS